CGSKRHDRAVRKRIFFYQAEDGIRDRTVTGVQTCALPISVALLAAPDAPGGSMWWSNRGDSRQRDLYAGCRGAASGAGRRSDRRSEERRVGKEWSTETAP